MIPVLVIEDNRIVRDAIAATLAAMPEFDVVGAVASAEAGLQHARDNQPQVVLIDASLGDHDSHRLIANVKRASPDARVIVMDLLPVPEDVLDFIRAGAAGFIAKDATIDDFVGAIRSVARVLEDFFPAKTAVPEGQVEEAGLSRIYGGIHYRLDITAGQNLGRSVADAAIYYDKFNGGLLATLRR
jgi:DNA-binding NarL/FixJ family response regulator